MKYVLALIGFGLLVIVHELGHFIMAKINKVKVIEFSIGMGPRILSYQGKETRYSLALLPIGGFVMLLDGEENIDDPGCMLNKSHLRRISVMIAGIIMNFLFAMALFTTFYYNVGFGSKALAEVTEDGAASEAGILPGDEITKVDGKKMYIYDDVSMAIAEAKDKEMEIEYVRNGESYKTNLIPKYNEEYDRYMIGVSFEKIQNPSVIESLKHSTFETRTLVNETLFSIKKLVTGKGNFKTDVGGPVSVVKVSASAAEMGIWNFIYLIGILSISLAVFNALPFPKLDGGTTLILLIEMITRRKVPEKVLTAINAFGFIMLMILMVAVTIKDILFPISL